MEKGKDPSDTEPDNDIDQSESDENEHTPPLAYEEELTVLPLDVQVYSANQIYRKPKCSSDGFVF